ncbi:MAG: DUF5666 domain-containing protein [Chromatiales bacterium]|jgi:hypothetical protein
MQRKSLFSTMTIVLATAGLAACGGGGGGDDTTTTTTTSSRTIVGEITAFGSVYVNGIEFDTTSSSYDVDDDSAADEADLAVGMMVRIEGTVNDDGLTGSATSIYYDDEVEGPIANLMQPDAITKTFTVLDLDVLVDANTTVFDDISFDNLADGMVVEVSGTFDGAQIIATRIEKQSDTDLEYELKGTVTSYDGNTISLTLVNGMDAGPYDAGNATSEIAVGTTGVFVEVKLTDDGAGNLSASKIEADDADSLDGDEEDVSIHGLISGDYATGFVINTTPFTVNDSTQYQPTTLEDMLVAGMEVEVEGYMQDGTLIATKVESEHEGEEEIEIEARVTDLVVNDITTGTITLDMDGTNTLSVQTDSNTLFEDDSDLDSDGDGSFSLTELSSGQFLEIDAYLSDSGLVAAKLKRTDSIEATKLKAPVDSYATGSSITLLDITYTLVGTSYDVDDVSTTSTEFFNALDVGDIVEIKDTQPDGNAEEADLDQSS